MEFAPWLTKTLCWNSEAKSCTLTLPLLSGISNVCEMHFVGWRLTQNEASILPPGTVLTLPTVATASFAAFSMAVHLKPATDTKINLLNSAIVFDAATNLSLTIRFVREFISKLSDWRNYLWYHDMLDSWTWVKICEIIIPYVWWMRRTQYLSYWEFIFILDIV